MNQNQLITQIGYRLRTASRTFITSDEIKAELNRSISRLSSKIDLEDSISIHTIAYTADGSYALPSDFKKPIAVYDRSNNNKYTRVSKSEIYEGEDDGLYLYAIDGSNILIEGAGGSVTITLTYYSTNDSQTSGGAKQEGLSTGTDLPLLQPRFHDFFVEDVASVLYRKERKFDDYNIAKAEARIIYQDIADANPTREETIITVFDPYPETYT